MYVSLSLFVSIAAFVRDFDDGASTTNGRASPRDRRCTCHLGIKQAEGRVDGGKGGMEFLLRRTREDGTNIRTDLWIIEGNMSRGKCVAAPKNKTIEIAGSEKGY